MALVLSAPTGNPNVFTPPRLVHTRVGIRDTAGDNLAHVTYDATDPMRIDGSTHQDGGQHAVNTIERFVNHDFTVTGPPGAYDLIVTAEPIDANGNPTGPAVSRSCTLTLT